MESAHLLIVSADFYQDLAAELKKGAAQAIDNVNGTYELVNVPGALEVPAAIRFAIKAMDLVGGRRRYDGYVALGCVIRGETTHYDLVAGESARALMDLALTFSIAVGNGIVTVENQDQAWARASVDQMNKGGGAASAALEMIKLKQQLGFFPR